jgi:hypothetical protein
MHCKLPAAGVDTELHVFEAMPHTGFGGTRPEDIELKAAIRTFLDRHRRAPRLHNPGVGSGNSDPATFIMGDESGIYDLLGSPAVIESRRDRVTLRDAVNEEAITD